MPLVDHQPTLVGDDLGRTGHDRSIGERPHLRPLLFHLLRDQGSDPAAVGPQGGEFLAEIGDDGLAGVGGSRGPVVGHEVEQGPSSS